MSLINIDTVSFNKTLKDALKSPFGIATLLLRPFDPENAQNYSTQTLDHGALV